MSDSTANALASLRQTVEQGLADLNYPEAPRNLYEPIAYILALGGKRMRPILTLMGCEVFGEPGEKALPQALAIEIFHNFTLVHDDIMDEAPLRRSQPTVHEKWNPNTALLAGDVMLVQAYQQLMQCELPLLPDLMRTFNDTAVLVCEGQQEDMNFETREDVAPEEYLEMIRRKTAVLLGGSLEIGARVGSASAEDAAQLKAFGENLGVAFQIKDDWLDVFGDPEKFGKQVGGDILANKKTLMLILALQKAQGAHADELARWLSRSDAPTEKVAAVTRLYETLHIGEDVTAQMEDYYERALQALDAVQAPEERKAPLRMLAANLMVRDH